MHTASFETTSGKIIKLPVDDIIHVAECDGFQLVTKRKVFRVVEDLAEINRRINTPAFTL